MPTQYVFAPRPSPPKNQGPQLGWYDQKICLILGSSLNLRNNPKLNPVLGVGLAPRVNDWVQSGSGWPPGSEIYQIIQFQAVLAKFNQLQLPINHTNYVVN